MSVFEVGKTISESTGGHASAGGNSGAGNRFFFSDDAYCELGLQRGTAYNVRIRLKGATSGFIKLTMIGHRGYAPNAIGNSPFCYIVEALPQNMGDRTALTSSVSNVATRSFEDGIEAQHLMGPGLDAGDFYPTVSCFQYTDYTEITLRVMNQSNTLESSQNRSNVVDTTATDHSAALTKHYAGNEDITTAGQAGEMGGDAIFFTAYIEGYSYNSTLAEGIFTSYNRFMGGRCVTGGGWPSTNVMDYFPIGVINTDAVDFGDMTFATRNYGHASNGARGVIAAGEGAPVGDALQYYSFATTGNSVDFGEMAGTRHALTPIEDGNRAVLVGVEPSPPKLVEYFSIGVQGNALDFGDGIHNQRYPGGSTNGHRGVISGGDNDATDTMQYFTMGVLGNGVDYGEMFEGKSQFDAASDGARGIVGSGYPSADKLQYFNIGTIGDATEFGEASNAYGGGYASDGCRAVATGGGSPPTLYDLIEYVTIGTTGNATDFGGELTQARENLEAASGD